MENISVINNREEQRFEVRLDNHIALLQYEERDGLLVLLHTEVPDAFEGQGIASKLAKYALDWARDANMKVKVYCSFVNGYLKRHKEYNDLLV